MAHCGSLSCLSIVLLLSPGILAVTWPGFPGYCSESFPGMSCNVVCSRGRNNVPLCQEDGTWTDIPRCIEHDPGVEEQVPGLCPGIPGYCAVGFINTQCKFDCYTGPDIDSICTADGTWAPYPTCEGDLRETQNCRVNHCIKHRFGPSSPKDCGGLRGKKKRSFVCREHQHWTCRDKTSGTRKTYSDPQDNHEGSTSFCQEETDCVNIQATWRRVSHCKHQTTCPTRTT